MRHATPKPRPPGERSAVGLDTASRPCRRSPGRRGSTRRACRRGRRRARRDGLGSAPARLADGQKADWDRGAFTVTQREPLRDGHARLIGDLRLSVVDRCNFRCQYCMPAEGLPWLDRSEILTFEETKRLVGLFASMGVGDLRLTGGEPLVRREFPKLVAMLRGVEDLREISVTTNGYLLERDAESLVRAGVDRFNVSIDTLARDAFFKITRRDALAQVMRGLEAIAALPEVRPIKVNAIALLDLTEREG